MYINPSELGAAREGAPMGPTELRRERVLCNLVGSGSLETGFFFHGQQMGH